MAPRRAAGFSPRRCEIASRSSSDSTITCPTSSRGSRCARRRSWGSQIEEAGAQEIGRRARGTPRIANRLLRRIRDFAEVQGRGVVDLAAAISALAQLEIDESGLDVMDRRILSTIIDKFDGGPVGLETIAASVGEERDTIEDVYEPFLLQQGLLQRTPRGRVATARAFAHLGRAMPSAPQGHLF